MTQQPLSFIDYFFHCTSQLAAAQSNAVLAVLNGGASIAQEVRYPPEGLLFNGAPWRAYYHCHPSPLTIPDEHGHFHLFRRVNEDDDESAWAHVAGLAMDRCGQPLYWAALNRWVTGGPWLNTEHLAGALADLNDMTEQRLTALAPVEGWLLSMVGIFGSDLLELLQRRDRKLVALQQQRGDVFEDRTLYGFGNVPIDMKTRLTELVDASRIGTP